MNLAGTWDRHADLTPRWSFLQRVKRWYKALGWQYAHPDAPGVKQVEQRARALDALEKNNPSQYHHVMRMRVDRAVAMDRATEGRVSRTRDSDHASGGSITSTRKESNMHRRNDYETRMHRALDALLDRFERRKRARAAARATDEANRNGDLQAAYERRRLAGGQFYKPEDGRAVDAVRDPLEERWGSRQTPYAGRLGDVVRDAAALEGRS